MTWSRRSAAAVLLMAGTALVACDSGGGTQEPPPTPTIAIAAAAGSVDVLPGGSANITVNLTRGGGYTGAVTLAAEGLPAGVTIAGGSIAAGATSATLTVNATAAAAVASTPVTIRATGTGVSAATTSVTVNVLQPPGIGIALNPVAATIQQGATAQVAVTLTRLGNYAGAVTLTAENLPTGVTMQQATIAAGTNTATLTFNAAANATLGVGAVVIRATGTNVTAVTAPLALTVTAPPPVPSIQVALVPNAVSAAPGGSASFTVNLTRAGGFTGAVTLTAEGLPTGVTIGNATIAAGATSAQMTVNVAAGTAAGTSAVNIRATGTGVTAQVAPLSVTVTAAPGIAIALNPAALSVNQGAAGNFTVTLNRSGGFNGAVTLAAEGLPANVTLPNVTIAEGATTAQMTVTAGAAAAAGATNVTIRATGTGVTAATAALALTVTQPAGFTMALNPGTLNIAQGAQGQSTLTVTRTGAFAAAVNLAASGAPNGITVTFNPASVTQTTSAITVAVGAGVAPGSYPITITGTGTGVANQTATLNVTVTGGGGQGNIIWQFCPTDPQPIWAAAQDGTGAWQRVQPDAQNRYIFQVTQRGGFAWVEQTGNGIFETTVVYLTTQEMQAFAASNCAFGPGALKTINLTFTGLPAGSWAMVDLGNAGFAFNAPGTLEGVAPGPVDLIAARWPGQFGSAANRFVLQRGLNPANNSTVNVDFTGANSFDPVVRNVTINNLGGDMPLVNAFYLTAGGSTAVLESTFAFGGAPTQYRGIPGDRQIAGDFHMLNIAGANLQTQESRGVTRWFTAATDQTITLGPQLSLPQVVTLASQPYARLRGTYTVQPDYNTYFTLNLAQANPERQIAMQMSAAYNQNAATAAIEVPNFVGLAGWNNTWGLQAGSAVEWTFSGTRLSTGNIITPMANDQSAWAATRIGTITP